ncbi:hypothetical protein ZW11_21020 [Salmonella enterica subsp. diarizonae]|nr:hypothetical protein [Salmonella enterica subsp. diarizonae]EEJ8833974.1 hypothetical protein [Salmonella enterica subsp. diarizonae]SUG62487.1 Uncharacterised protein [Salmonella enterica subsp. arizonae]
MKELTYKACEKINGTGIIGAIGTVISGAVNVANAATGGHLGSGLGQQWGAEPYCRRIANGNANDATPDAYKTDPRAIKNYNDCMANPTSWGFKKSGPW